MVALNQSPVKRCVNTSKPVLLASHSSSTYAKPLIAVARWKFHAIPLLLSRLRSILTQEYLRLLGMPGTEQVSAAL